MLYIHTTDSNDVKSDKGIKANNVNVFHDVEKFFVENQKSPPKVKKMSNQPPCGEGNII